MEVPDVRRLKELEVENTGLKRLVARNEVGRFGMRQLRCVVIAVCSITLLVAAGALAGTGSSGPVVLAIDGLALAEVDLFNVEPLAWMRREPDGYLAAAIRGAHSVDSSVRVESLTWGRDPETDTRSAVDALKNRLTALSTTAQESSRPFVVVAHSWGGVLAYIALTELENVTTAGAVRVDQLATLGTPLAVSGSSAVARKIASLRSGAGLAIPDHRPSNVCIWTNWWAQRDAFSSSVPVADINIQIDAGIEKGTSSQPAAPLRLGAAEAEINLVSPSFSIGPTAMSTPAMIRDEETLWKATEFWHPAYFRAVASYHGVYQSGEAILPRFTLDVLERDWADMIPRKRCRSPQFMEPVAPSGTRRGGLEPPEEIIDREGWPGEMGPAPTRWVAKQEVVAYASPTPLGALGSERRRIATVPAGEWAAVRSAMVLVEGGQGILGERWTWSVIDPAKSGHRLGESVSIYSYMSEGCYRTWDAGEFDIVCGVDVDSETRSERWVEIVLPDGSLAWTNSSSFKTFEELNGEIGEVIEDAALPLSEKLTRIDQLIAKGAGLNGHGPRYGFSPGEAAVRSNDVPLLRQLVKRGLELAPSGSCLADLMGGTSMERGGAQALDWLLSHGLRLDCVSKPVIGEFLMFGIATPQYSVERAMDVSRVLLAHGIDLRERGPDGKSIFDKIERSATSQMPGAERMTENLIALRDALMNLEASVRH